MLRIFFLRKEQQRNNKETTEEDQGMLLSFGKNNREEDRRSRGRGGVPEVQDLVLRFALLRSSFLQQRCPCHSEKNSRYALCTVAYGGAMVRTLLRLRARLRYISTCLNLLLKNSKKKGFAPFFIVSKIALFLIFLKLKKEKGFCPFFYSTFFCANFSIFEI